MESLVLELFDKLPRSFVESTLASLKAGTALPVKKLEAYRAHLEKGADLFIVIEEFLAKAEAQAAALLSQPPVNPTPPTNDPPEPEAPPAE